MMTSNSSDPVETTGSETASPEQMSAPESKEVAPKEPTSLKETIKSKAAAASEEKETTPAAPLQPTYSPNFKYKAFGKEQELEEFWRPLIKDQDSEKKVKDLFTRADAFDDMKTKYEGTQTEFSQLVQEYTALDKDVKRVMRFRNDGDLDNFFSALKIPHSQIYDWVQQKLQLENLPPEQRQALESQARERQQRYDLEQEKEELQQQYQTQAVQARTMQLDMTLSRPDVSGIASAVDSRVGRLGAFRDLVIEEAQKVYYATGQDLSAEQATGLVIQKYGKLFEPGAAPQAQMQTQAQAPQVQSKPVIPAVHGRGTSPIKKAPKSVDDLRAAYKEIANQNG